MIRYRGEDNRECCYINLEETSNAKKRCCEILLGEMFGNFNVLLFMILIKLKKIYF